MDATVATGAAAMMAIRNITTKLSLPIPPIATLITLLFMSRRRERYEILLSSLTTFRKTQSR